MKLEKSGTGDILHRKYFRILTFQFLNLKGKMTEKTLYIYTMFYSANGLEKTQYNNHD